MPIKSLQELTLSKVSNYGIFSEKDPAKNDKEQQTGIYYVMNNILIKTLSPMMPKFILAIVDEDMATLKTMLDEYPQLLLIQPDPDLVVKSELTSQCFYADMAFTMAAQRKQINIIQFLIPYFEKLETSGFIKNAKEIMHKLWRTMDDEPETVDHYLHHFDNLIQEFVNDTAEDGILSDETERAITELNEALHPSEPITLSTYLNIELLLLAAYIRFNENYRILSDENHNEICNIFNIRVIGLIQSVLKKRMAMIYCEGLKEMCEHPITVMSERATNLISKKSHHIKPYYSMNEYRLGYASFATAFGNRSKFLMCWPKTEEECLAKLLSDDEKMLAELYAEITPPSTSYTKLK